jgi:hypothetical protein
LELKIVITDILPHWTQILHQIGVQFQKIKFNEEIKSDDYPVVVVSAIQNSKNKKILNKYLEDGGSVLTEAGVANQVFEFPSSSLFVKYVTPENSSPLKYMPLFDLDLKTRVHQESNFLANQDGKYTCSIQKIKKGNLIVFPEGFTNLVTEYQIKRKNFLTINNKGFPSERVSGVTKAGIRLAIYRALIYLFNIRGLPLIHTWNLPSGMQGLFCFRIDTDFASQYQVEECYNICRKNDISASWFIETKSQKGWIDFYSKMEKQEIAYHCYTHRIFEDYKANLNDIESGLNILQRAGIESKGYAAPNGEWNGALNEALQTKGFSYSSEFGFSYDDLPFFPFVRKGFSEILQIPIHPISSRRLKVAKHSENEIFQYYVRVISEKQLLGEPIIFYHHPIHEHFEVFDKLFIEIQARKIPNLSMIEYAEWWRKRILAKFTVHYLNGNLDIRTLNTDPSIWLLAHFPSGKRELIQLIQQDHKKDLPPIPDNIDNDYNPKKLRKFNWRMMISDFENYVGKTRR